MDKSYKKPLLLITFGVILFAAFNNLNYVANFLKSVLACSLRFYQAFCWPLF